MNNDIQNLSVKELLGVSEYRIPIYQRNYAWGISETTQLIQDVADYAKDNFNSFYYIGNLIVFPRYIDNRLYYETIDGQQRTTTLSIILCSIKHNKPEYDLSWYPRVNISFEHWEKSTYTLNMLFNSPDSAMQSEDVNPNIITVYNKVWGIIDTICKDRNLKVSDFVDYLLNNVKILRISVPKDTNLNHYFEIMNSRGEQLEQHEIIKAWLMSKLQNYNDWMAAFNLIWESCSNMDRYVHMNFKKSVRMFMFDNYGTGRLNVEFEELADFIRLNPAADVDSEKKSLYELFEDSRNNKPYRKPWEEEKEDVPESYVSLISFPNFLLHVLKIIRPDDSEVVLDDKKLTKIFDSVMDREKDKAEFSKLFIMKLLEIRCLFDKYIIKRKQERWSLKRILPQNNDVNKYYYKDTFYTEDKENDKKDYNRIIVLLLSMFHVSAPTQIYKHWMNAALYYVYKNQGTTAEDYAGYLWALAKAYMLDRYLSDEDKKVDFEDIIFKNDGKNRNNISTINWANININEYPQVGEHVENFVFNFYDFILWEHNNDPDFYFGYRNSVEHFYPQHPIDKSPMDSDHLHSFGNLCLIGRGMNAKFSNNMPGAKYQDYGKNPDMLKTYSLKLKDMMECMRLNNLKKRVLSVLKYPPDVIVRTDP